MSIEALGIDGNYQLAPGVCAWWDGVARGVAAE